MDKTPFEMLVVTRDVMSLVIAALARDQQARHAIISINKVLHIIREKEKADAVVCACPDCGVEFWRDNLPDGFAVFLPMFPRSEADPNRPETIVTPLCERCLHRSDLNEQVLASLRKAYGDSVEMQRIGRTQ